MSPLLPLLHEMLEAGASDLFLAEGRPPARRIDGKVSVTLHAPTPRETLAELMASVLRPAQRETFDRLGDVDVGLTLPEIGRFRIHFHTQRGALGAVVRAVPSGQVSFEDLMLPASLRELAEAPRGLVLVTGATGSGKSTTVAAMIHHVNSSFEKHIVSLEDPIEFVHEDMLSVVTQREIGSDTPDFASGLRNVLREAPDVILIGEMRDADTVRVALSAALTGHLVLSTLHTIDATQTLQRMLGYFPEHLRAQVATDLALCLQGIVAQRLVPRAEGDGRIPAVEVLLATPAVRRLLREQRVDEVAEVMAHGHGMETFNGALTSLWKRGLITHETGAAYATSPDEFRLATLGMGRSAAVAEDDDWTGEGVAGPVDMHALLTLAMQSGASDLHLVAGCRPLFRVNGRLTPLDGGPKTLSPAVVRRLLMSVFTHAQRERFDIEHELDFALSVTGGHRFRVNAHMQRGTAAAAIRLIPSRAPKVGELGLPPVVFDLSTRHQGLVLVTGPTGSGKSTTLAAMIDLINETRNCHVITIEDPIEFVHENRAATIEQRELGPDTASFAAALKYILRQDPDVILVGELRDQETIAAALTAAETGHLVLGTLHSNDAPQTIDRIVDIFPPHQQQQIRVQVASELCAVISQRLLRRADGQGRVAAFEVMTGTPAVRRLIRDSKAHQLQSAMETAGSDGMITMDKWVMELVRRGIVTRDEGAPYLRTPATQAQPIAAPQQGARAPGGDAERRGR